MNDGSVAKEPFLLPRFNPYMDQSEHPKKSLSNFTDAELSKWEFHPSFHRQRICGCSMPDLFVD